LVSDEQLGNQVTLIGKSVSHYQILSKIGAGGMASVYLADDLKHGRRVAIKVMNADIGAAIGTSRFLREIEIAARLTHPHILPLHDSGVIDEQPYYVMPYIEGQSLRQTMRSAKKPGANYRRAVVVAQIQPAKRVQA
jgi:serine/threonine protein kinase